MFIWGLCAGTFLIWLCDLTRFLTSDHGTSSLVMPHTKTVFVNQCWNLKVSKKHLNIYHIGWVGHYAVWRKYIGNVGQFTTNNSLCHSVSIWRNRFGWALAQLVASCLVATNHYLNYNWLITHDQFYRKCSTYQFVNEVWKTHLYNSIHSSQGLMS